MRSVPNYLPLSMALTVILEAEVMEAVPLMESSPMMVAYVAATIIWRSKLGGRG